MYRIVLVLVIVVVIALTGCGGSSDQTLWCPMTGDWGVDPGKIVVGGRYTGEYLYFDIVTKKNACFTVDGQQLCIESGREQIAMPFTGESYEFIVTKVGQGNVRSELLCKIEVR